MPKLKKTSDPRIVMAEVTHVAEQSGSALAVVGDETIRLQLNEGSHFEVEGDEHFFLRSKCKTKAKLGEFVVCIIGDERAKDETKYRMAAVWTTYVRWCNPDVAVKVKKHLAPQQPHHQRTPDKTRSQQVKKTYQPPSKHDLQGTGLEELVFPESLRPDVAPEVIFSKDDPRRFRVFHNTRTARPPRRAIRQQIAIGGLNHLRNKAVDFIADDIEVEVETGLRNSGNFVLCQNNPFLFFLPAAAA